MKQFAEKALELGIDNVAFIKTADIIFSEELRGSCEKNSCGNYGSNWMCPPGIGTVAECIERVKAFENGLLVQIFIHMKNSFDIIGMLEGGKRLKSIMTELKQELNHNYDIDFLVLGAGGCSICKKCAYITNEPCRFPNKAISSVEAHGIYVSDIMKKAGMKYKDGPNSIAYVGLVVF